MKRKKPKVIPAAASCERTLELKPTPAAGSCEPALDLKFLPPVTLSYESTLELKPIPVTVNTEDAGKAGRVAVRRVRKAAQTARGKKATEPVRKPGGSTPK